MKKVPVKPREYGAQPSTTPRDLTRIFSLKGDNGPKIKWDKSKFTKGKSH